LQIVFQELAWEAEIHFAGISEEAEKIIASLKKGLHCGTLQLQTTRKTV
jgi:hypothetical protein